MSDLGAHKARKSDVRTVRMSAAQRGVWYGQRLEPDNPMFNIAHYLDIRGDLDVALLERAFRRVLEESDALRARFVEHGDEPLQVLDRLDDWSLRVVDLRAEADPLAAAVDWMRGDLASPINPVRGLLFTVAALRLADQRFLVYQRVHHLVLDGYGASIVVARTAELYRALEAGEQPGDRFFGTLRELLAEEDEYRGSEQFAADAEFWRARLADRPVATMLTESTAPMADHCLRHSDDLPADEAVRLQAIARELGTSLPTLVVACFAAYLHRMTGDRDVVFGLPVTARRSATSRVTPGMLSNVLPLRLAVTPDVTVDELVRRASAEIREALRHQRYRAEDLRGDLGISRSAPLHGPSINVLPYDDHFDFGSHRATVHNLGVGPVDDLSCVVQRLSSGLRLDLDANPRRYSTAELGGHATRFLRVLRSVAADPGVRVGDLELLDDAERRASLPEPTAPAEPATLPELFADRVAATPDAPVLRDDAESLTAAELDARSSRLARALIHRGIGPGDTVAVVAGRTAGTITALLAVSKAGAAYLPLDPAYPTDRLAYLVADARPAVVLATADQAGLLPHGTATLPLDGPELAAELASYCGDAPGQADRVRPLRPGDPAYVVYTSGSTGRPKGVVIEHGSLANLFAQHVETVFGPAVEAAGRPLRVVHLAGTAFDAWWDAVLWLVAGHELLMLDDAVRRDPQECVDYLARERVDVLGTTPSYLRQMLDAGLLDGPHRPSVVHVGGEPVDPELWRELAGTPGLLAFNFYGPTEATVDSVIARLDAVAEPAIGTAVRGTAAYVLDAALRPVPADVPGELYLAGAGLARGYHDRPALTAERFPADPFRADGSRMYRTGDLARRRAGGALEFVGRADDQVKIRGHRVEPGELEAALAARPEVSRAAVAVRGNDDTDRRLLGYVTPSTVDTDAVRAALAARLPEYLLPQAVVALAELPLTANGKLDRDRLPEPATSGPGREPADRVERVLCELFAQTLGVPSAGVEDDFFALGGHSLLATRLVGAIRSALGVEVSIRTLFESPTPARLAARIGRDAGTGPEATTRRPVPRRAERPERPPLSSAQRRLWFLHRLNPDSAEYHMPVVLRLEGRLDVDALRGALEDLVARHEALRTVVVDDGSGPYQRVLPAAGVELPVEEVDRDGLEGRVRAESAHGFDLAGRIPLRARLLRVAPEEHVLVLVIHHIAGDGWSFAPLARDLGANYAARVRGSRPALPALSVQYADYALWQRELLGDESDQDSLAARQLAFWKSTLDALPELTLPLDRPRPTEPSGRGDAVRIELPASVHERITALAAAHGASTFMVLHAALSAWLHRMGAGTDIPVGTAVAGRTDDALADLVGFFVNTLVLRADVSGDPSFTELLRRVTEADLAALEHQDLPFDRVVEELAPQRVLGRNPLFDVMLTLQNNAAPELELPGLDVSAMDEHATGTAKFDLSVTLAETFADDGTPAGIAGDLEYATDLFDTDTARRFAETFTRLVGELVREPHRPVRRG
ncbi:non-ribosomal peptide synthetase, partial [Streptomyces sp. CT34]|uniref:non-ribosomal peptide synthetase n=1 Tax=Streptomyces sp. CT34 TaxID=1553907 RepID=UPI0018E2EF69